MALLPKEYINRKCLLKKKESTSDYNLCWRNPNCYLEEPKKFHIALSNVTSSSQPYGICGYSPKDMNNIDKVMKIPF